MWTITENKEWSQLEEQFEWVDAMRSVPQDPRHHAEGNVAIHTQMVLDALTKEPAYKALTEQEQEILWASALLHDVEKRSTTETHPDGRITSHGHARRGAMTARRLLYTDIPTPFAIREQIVALVRYHGLPLWLFEKPDPVKHLIKASYEVNTRWLALLARVDALGRICEDRDELLYRIDCFAELCKEQNCWGQARPFASSYARMHYLSREDAYPDYVPFETPTTEIILMSGLPGAGKDSYIKRHFPDLQVISLDTIREELDVAATDKSGNGQVIQLAKERARVLLRTQFSFVWNATNITRQMRTQLIDLFQTYRAAVKIIYIETPYAQLHRQNRNRDAVVPATVMERLIGKLEVPAAWEAHEVVYVV